jgi:hypothetical protein
VRGFATLNVAAAMGHTPKTFMQGTTARAYVGGSDVCIWSLRAESDHVDRQASKVAESRFKPTRPSPEEIQAYCLKQGWTDDTKAGVIAKRAKRHLEQDQEDVWRAEKRAAMTANL